MSTTENDDHLATRQPRDVASVAAFVSTQNREAGQPTARAIALREVMAPLIERLADRPETAGVCVLGSFALSGIRPAADKFSDFDIALFLKLDVPADILSLPVIPFQRAVQPYLPQWLPNFKFLYPGADPLGESDALPLQINIHQLVYDYEVQDSIVWTADRREAFSRTCDVVYDLDRKIASLIEAKSPPPPAELERRLNDNVALIPVTIEHSVDKCIYRNLFSDALLAISETSDYLLDLVYALNGKDLPHRKWRISLLETLPLKPEQMGPRLGNILASPGLRREDVWMKRLALLELFEELRLLVVSNVVLGDDPYRKLITQTRPGFQLRDHSFADETLERFDDQYEKMLDKNWNNLNFGSLASE
jgi:hypothetical protein